MEEKPKKKIPLFPKYKTTSLFKNHNGNAMFSSSDDSDILNDSSDYETNEDKNNDNKIEIIKQNEFMRMKTFNIEVDKTNDNDSCLTPRKSIDGFRDIEEYVSKSAYENKNINKINDNKNKNKKKEEKSSDKKDNKKENKIINDFFINNEGDIEFKEENKKDGKNKQNSNKNNNYMAKSLGPLMEEDENFGSIFINQNKSIFNSKKELWKFQKILLANQIIDFKSKNYKYFIYYI